MHTFLLIQRALTDSSATDLSAVRQVLGGGCCEVARPIVEEIFDESAREKRRWEPDSARQRPRRRPSYEEEKVAVLHGPAAAQST